MDGNNISNEALTELQIKIKDYSDNVFKQITEEVSSNMTNKTKDVIDLLGKDIIESIYGDLLNAINESTSQSEINETLRKTYDDKIKLIYDLAKDINESDKKNEEIIEEELSNGKVENSEKVVVKEEKTEEKEPEEEKIVEEENEEKTEEKEPEEEKIVEEKPQAEEIIEEQKENEQLDKTLEDVKNVEEKIEKKNNDEVDLTSWLKNLPLLKGKESNNEEESTTIIDTAKVKLMSLFGGSREKEETEEKNKNEDKTKNPPNIKDESWFKEKNLLTYQEYLLINSLKTPGDIENNKSIAIANLVRARIAWMSAQVEYFDKMMKNNKKINKAYMKETSILSKIMGAGEEGFSLFTTFLKGKLLLIAAAAVTAILLCFEKTRGWVIEGLSKLKEWAWNAAENLFTTWVDSALLGYDNPNGPTGIALLDSLANSKRWEDAEETAYIPIGPNGEFGYEEIPSAGQYMLQGLVQGIPSLIGGEYLRKPIGTMIKFYNTLTRDRAIKVNEQLWGYKTPNGEVIILDSFSSLEKWKKNLDNNKSMSDEAKKPYYERLDEISSRLAAKEAYKNKSKRAIEPQKKEEDEEWLKLDKERSRLSEEQTAINNSRQYWDEENIFQHILHDGDLQTMSDFQRETKFNFLLSRIGIFDDDFGEKRKINLFGKDYKSLDYKNDEIFRKVYREYMSGVYEYRKKHFMDNLEEIDVRKKEIDLKIQKRENEIKEKQVEYDNFESIFTKFTPTLFALISGGISQNEYLADEDMGVILKRIDNEIENLHTHEDEIDPRYLNAIYSIHKKVVEENGLGEFNQKKYIGTFNNIFKENSINVDLKNNLDKRQESKWYHWVWLPSAVKHLHDVHSENAMIRKMDKKLEKQAEQIKQNSKTTNEKTINGGTFEVTTKKEDEISLKNSSWNALSTVASF